MSQDADTTLSGASEHVPNSRGEDAPPPGHALATTSRTPASESREDWARLAARLHDELVGLLTRRPDAAVDLAPAMELAGRLRAEGERSLRWIAVHGGDHAAGSGEAGGDDTARAPQAFAQWLGLGLLDEYAAVPRERLIREAARFERRGPRAGEAGAAPGPAVGGRPASGPAFTDPGDAVGSGAAPAPAVDRRLPPGLDDQAGRRFAVEGRSLHEYALDSDRPPVSVSQADYERIARSLASLCLAGDEGDLEPTQAKQLREATGEADRTDPLEPRLVSLTHVYICLRLWQAARLVRRQTGGWFVPVRLQTGELPTDEAFVAAAMGIWRDLAQMAEPAAADVD